MDRADRDLVQTLAFDRQEGVARVTRLAGPASVIEPGAGIVEPERLGAV